MFQAAYKESGQNEIFGNDTGTNLNRALVEKFTDHPCTDTFPAPVPTEVPAGDACYSDCSEPFVEVLVQDVLAHFARVDRMPEPIHHFLVQVDVVHLHVADHHLVLVLAVVVAVRGAADAADRVVVGIPRATTRHRRPTLVVDRSDRYRTAAGQLTAVVAAELDPKLTTSPKSYYAMLV